MKLLTDWFTDLSKARVCNSLIVRKKRREHYAVLPSINHGHERGMKTVLQFSASSVKSHYFGRSCKVVRCGLIANG